MPAKTPEQALGEIEPRSIAGQLRGLLPLIVQKLDDGATYEQILSALKDTGLNVNIHTLKSYVQRFRRSRKPAQATERKSTPDATKLLSKIMRPDADQEAADLDEYERRGKSMLFKKQSPEEDTQQ